MSRVMYKTLVLNSTSGHFKVSISVGRSGEIMFC